MADGGVDIDLYSDDIDQGFGPIKVRILVKFSKIFPIFNNLAITSHGKFNRFFIYAHFLQDEYAGEDDLYDDVIAAPSSEPHERVDNENGSAVPQERSDGVDTNGGYMHIGNNLAPNHIGRRHQLYVGNLTWVSVYIVWRRNDDDDDIVRVRGHSASDY